MAIRNLPGDNNSISLPSYEWIKYAEAYFESSKLLIQSILTITELKSDYFYPGLYCFHHGIELFLKGITFLLREDDPEKSHNISSLFRVLKTEITKKKKKIKTEGRIDTIEECLSQLEQVVTKYYNREILNTYYICDNRINLKVCDPNNELFRYPVAKNIEIKITADLKNEMHRTLLEEINAEIKLAVENFKNIEDLVIDVLI